MAAAKPPSVASVLSFVVAVVVGACAAGARAGGGGPRFGGVLVSTEANSLQVGPSSSRRLLLRSYHRKTRHQKPRR